MSYMVQIDNLKFSYESNLILDIPKFEIKKGEIVFLQGPSGSGKSTLLEILAGILKVQLGRVSVDQKDLSQMSLQELDAFRAENTGYIFQSFNLIPYLSVEENIVLPFLFKKPVQSQDIEDLKNSLVTGLGLQKYLQKPVHQLSVGQQQRVAAARALIKKPKLILADEPTSALDYGHREDFLKILFELCGLNETTMLFVSHDLSITKLFNRNIKLDEINQAGKNELV